MSPRAVLLSALALAVATPAHAGDSAWTIAESSGSVSVMVQGRPSRAEPGAAVPVDAALLTGGDGRAVLSRGADRVILSANGKMRFTTDNGVVADRGRASFSGAAAVATPFLRANAAGGRFSVTVTPGGATVSPDAGKVYVATLGGEARQSVEPGMVAIVGADQPGRLVIDGSRRTMIGSASPNAVRASADGAVMIAALQ